MSKKESPMEEPRVSPYLLRPARTYEEYLRDRAIAERVQKQVNESPAFSVVVSQKNQPTDNTA